MYSRDRAWERVQQRGPRYAIIGSIRPDEARCEYAETAGAAERIRGDFTSQHYHQVQVYPPAGSVDLRALGEARRKARETFDEATAILRAGVLRALEDNRAEAEVAREALVDRMTVRAWAGK